MVAYSERVVANSGLIGSPTEQAAPLGCALIAVHMEVISLLDRDCDGVLRANGCVVRATSREGDHAALAAVVDLRLGEQHVLERGDPGLIMTGAIVPALE